MRTVSTPRKRRKPATGVLRKSRLSINQILRTAYGRYTTDRRTLQAMERLLG